MRKAGLLCVWMAAGIWVLRADFTVTEKTKITGGAMGSMMQVMGKFSKSLSGESDTTQYYKGNRMATATKDITIVWDLDGEKITQVDHKKKEYSVITLAEMAEASAKMMEKMGQGSKDQGVQVNYKFSADRTGKKRMVAGSDAEQLILKLVVDMQDTKNKGSAQYDVVSDLWMGTVPGYAAVKEFQRKVGEKWADSFSTKGTMAALASQPGMADGMKEASKKIGEMEGMPLLTVVRFVAAGQAEAAAAAAKQGEQAPQAPPQQQEAKGPSAKDAVVGGLLGGFGGFGRRKKPTEQQAPPPDQAPAGGQGQPASFSGSLIETTSEVISYSSAPVDPKVMEVPAGYKQVDHPMKEFLKKK